MHDLVTPTIERLNPQGQPWMAVEGLLDLSEIDEQSKNRLPRLYVIELAERASPDIRGTGPALQNLQLEIAVVMLLDKRNGKSRTADLRTIRQGIRHKLFGWAPDGGEPYQLSGGGLFQLNSGYIAWMDRFITEYTEDAAHGS